METLRTTVSFYLALQVLNVDRLLARVLTQVGVLTSQLILAWQNNLRGTRVNLGS